MRLAAKTKTDIVIALVVLLLVAETLLAIWLSPRFPLPVLDAGDYFVMVAMLICVVAVDVVSTSVPQFKFNVRFTVAGAAYIAAAIGYSTLIGIGVAVLGSWVSEAISRREARKQIFNNAQLAIATATAGLIYHALVRGDTRIPLLSAWSIVAALIASACYVLMNAALISLVVGASIERSPVTIFIANLPGLLAQNVTLPSVGLLLTTVRDLNPLSFFIVVLPIFGPWLAMRGHRETLLQIQRTIEALADAVDRRDVTTAQHSERVAGYVQQIIDEIGTIKFSEAEAIILAARVHDLGKIAIPDAVLLKPGRLDDEEYRLMRSHPVAGDEVLRRLSIYKDSLGVVRHHHERYDGRGYPDGLKGEEIPFGARIVGVADTYDVITSDRPYHRARSIREAKEELIACKGTQFDPMVVEAFIRVLDRVHGATPVAQEVPESAEALVSVAASH